MDNQSRWEKMSETEIWKDYETLNQKEKGELLDFVQTKRYKANEKLAFNTHKQPCNCLDCRVYRQRIRIKMKRIPQRNPR